MRALLLLLLSANLCIAGDSTATSGPTKEGELNDFIVPVGWNALLHKPQKMALVIGERKTPSRVRSVMTLLNRPSEAELLAEIKRMGYFAVRQGTSSGPKSGDTSTDSKSGKPDRLQLLPGWNAILNKNMKTAKVLPEIKNVAYLNWDAKSAPKPEVLHRDSKDALLAELNLLGFSIMPSSANKTK